MFGVKERRECLLPHLLAAHLGISLYHLPLLHFLLCIRPSGAVSAQVLPAHLYCQKASLHPCPLFRLRHHLHQNQMDWVIQLLEREIQLATRQ